MFGRLIDVFVSRQDGTTIQIVNHEDGVNNLICSGKIVEQPIEGGVTSCILSVFNLGPSIRARLAAENYKYIVIKWGYQDEGNTLSTLFKGTIQRVINQRKDEITTETKFFIWDCGDFMKYGFFSGSYSDGVSYWNIAQDVVNNGQQKITLIASKTLKNYYTKNAMTLFDSQSNILQKIASDTGMLFSSKNDICYITDRKSNEAQEVIVFNKISSGGKIESNSGLIGIPRLADDGLYFDCLINTKLKIYGLVLMSNSIISNEQEGFVSERQTGAEFDSNGLYRVIKIETDFTNGPGQCQSSVKALAKDAYNELI